MIRRWSCVISINNNFNKNTIFKKKFRINLFKTSVNLKRFTYNYTKFKRKSLIRIKHKNNFLIYTNIIKFWIKHYLFNKNYLKYQYFNKIFINNNFFFNLPFIKTSNDILKNNYNFIFSNFTNKNYNYFFKTQINPFFKHLPLTTSYSLTNVIKTNEILPTYVTYDNLYYNLMNDFNKFIEDDFIFTLFFNINIKYLIEIRKILIIVFLNALKK